MGIRSSKAAGFLLLVLLLIVKLNDFPSPYRFLFHPHGKGPLQPAQLCSVSNLLLLRVSVVQPCSTVKRSVSQARLGHPHTRTYTVWPIDSLPWEVIYWTWCDWFWAIFTYCRRSVLRLPVSVKPLFLYACLFIWFAIVIVYMVYMGISLSRIHYNTCTAVEKGRKCEECVINRRHLALTYLLFLTFETH